MTPQLQRARNERCDPDKTVSWTDSMLGQPEVVCTDEGRTGDAGPLQVLLGEELAVIQELRIVVGGQAPCGLGGRAALRLGGGRPARQRHAGARLPRRLPPRCLHVDAPAHAVPCLLPTEQVARVQGTVRTGVFAVVLFMKLGWRLYLGLRHPPTGTLEGNRLNRCGWIEGIKRSP